MGTPDPAEMFRIVEWPFPDGQFPRHLGAVVMRSVLQGRRPSLQVVHFPDGGWAVADGVDDPNEKGAIAVAHIWHVLEQDRTLLELASLPPGHVADREAAGAPWIVSRFEYDPD